MPVYEYTAISPSGKETKGSLDAENVRAARQKLRGQGIFPTDIKEGLEVAKGASRDVKQILQGNRVSVGELSVATRQLSTLVGAGLPLVSALQALSEQVASVVLKRTIIDVKEKVEEGSTLAKAMGSFPKAFPKLYINMVASGEASGSLDAVLENLADYLESQQELRRKITSSLFYPALMLVFCVLVVTGLLAYVVPSIVQIFVKQHAALPLPTQILMKISDFLVGYWYLIIIGILGVIAAARWYYKQERGRDKVDLIVLGIPVVGPLYKKINTARIARTLSTLLSNGVQLLTALEIVRNIVANVHLARAVESAKEGVREGKSLARELGKRDIFPPMLIHMIAVGETSGKLEAMLARAGKAYENEVNAQLSGLTSLIEPLMMIGLGGIVFSIVISIMLPMVDMISIIQK